MQHFLNLSDASEATLRHWGNSYKLYRRLYIFLREGHHIVLHVLNGEATLWHKLHKLYTFLTVNQQTNKRGFKQLQQPNHAWGIVWLYYCMQFFFLGGHSEVSLELQCFTAELITNIVCECDAPECPWCWSWYRFWQLIYFSLNQPLGWFSL